MNKTIRIKGVGKASSRPDTIVIPLSLITTDLEYDKAISLASSRIDLISKALMGIGFKKESIKTTSFNVDTRYKSIKDRYNNYQSVFEGYEVSHKLKIEFDLDMKLLSKALQAIADSDVKPKLSISYITRQALFIPFN